MNKVIIPVQYFCKYFLLTCLLLCLAFSHLSAENTSPKPFENYNIVLIFIDTLRADHLSCYGYFRKTSPNIDKLAKESIVFEQNFTPSPHTLSSFMSIITSLYPKSHGVLALVKDKLSPRVKTLAQILQTYGYKTAWFGPSCYDLALNLEAGFGWGFDDIGKSSSQNLNKSRKTLCNWLNRNKDKKFFLNFHTYSVHEPYLPSLKYKQKFTKNKKIEGVIEDREQLFESTCQFIKQKEEKVIEIMGREICDEFIASGLLEGNLRDKQKQIIDFFISKRKPPDALYTIQKYVYWSGVNLADPSVNARIQALYDADILEFDEEIIGPVIEELKALNLYDKTVIIIVGDHGEEFYEHGGHGHSRNLYEEVTHVPLIIRVPGIKHEKRIKELSQTVDIMPTLLDLVGIPVPHKAQGKSWVNFIMNKESLPPSYKYVFGQDFGMSSIRSKEWQFILHDDGNKELYYLVSDPKEQQNICSKHQNIAFELESQLRQWEASLPSYKDQEYSFPPEIDKATQERIRKTGYW